MYAAIKKIINSNCSTMDKLLCILISCVGIGTIYRTSALSDFTDHVPRHTCTLQDCNDKGQEPKNTWETEAITFYDGDSSFISTSNSPYLNLLLCVSGGHDSDFSNQEEDDDDDDDDDEMDGEDDDGANKMLSNVSVRRSKVTFQPHGASHFISSSVQIIESSIRDKIKRKKTVPAVNAAAPIRQVLSTSSSSSIFAALGIRGGASAAPAALVNNEFARRLIVAAIVTLLYEGAIGHLLEFLKIVMQTSPTGTSYAQVWKKITGGPKGIAGIYDGFIPWGVIQAVFKGGVFGFAYSIALSHLKPLVSKGVLPEQLALTLAGGIAGGFQGYVLSPTLLLKTRVMTNDAFRGSNTTMSVLNSTLLSFKIGYDVIANEGIFALMKGSNVFALKRLCDWASRYYFSGVFMHLILQYISKTPSLTSIEMFVADMLGGTASTIVTLPLDVIVAKIQDAKKAGKMVSPWSLLRDEYDRGGWNGLLGSQLQGFEVRLLHVCFTTVAMKTGTAIMYDFLFSKR